jgi:hypothetical protein
MEEKKLVYNACEHVKSPTAIKPTAIQQALLTL